LIVDFYQNLKTGPNAAALTRTKAEILRQAQLDLKRDSRYAHPFFWAPFVLIGDGR